MRKIVYIVLFILFSSLFAYPLGYKSLSTNQESSLTTNIAAVSPTVILQVEVTPTPTVPAVTLTAEDIAIYEKLTKSEFTIEEIGPHPCSEDPCTEVELGVFAVESKLNGYRINLGSTILKPYIDMFDYPNTDPISLKKVGPDLYFTSSKDKTFYKVSIKQKKVIPLYQGKNLYPFRNESLLANNILITTWTGSNAENDPNGTLIAYDLTTESIKSYSFDVIKGVDESQKHLLVQTADYVMPARGNPNLIWVLPLFETVWPKYPVINLSNGSVEYKSRSEMLWENQPEFPGYYPN